MMPPDIDSTDLFAKITAQPRPHQIVDFPRNDQNGNPVCEVAIVLLTARETIAVSEGAERTTRRILKDSMPNKSEESRGYTDIYNNASAMELLYRAVRNPDDLKKPFFPSKDAIGDALTSDEVSILLNHYFTTQVTLGPIVGAMTEIEVEAWIKKLQEGGNSAQFFLNSCSWEALKGLLIALASQLATSQTESASLSLRLKEALKTENPVEASQSTL